MTPELLPCPICGHFAYVTTDYAASASCLIYGVRCANDGECEAEITGFASAEAAAIRWNSRKTTYTHRNGETEAPSLAGRYWFKGRRFHQWRGRQDGDWFDDSGSLLLVNGMGDIDPYGSYWTCGDLVDCDGQWWGPIVAPWGQDA